MANFIQLDIGGGPQDPSGNYPTTFYIEYIQFEGRIGLTTVGPNAGLHTFNRALTQLYSNVNIQTANNRFNYAKIWTDYILAQMGILISKTNKGFNLIKARDGSLFSINPDFSMFEFVQGEITPGSRFEWKQYVASEGSEFIQFTPEFNIPTKFDNCNFYRAEDDNYTGFVSEFINAPSVEKALFIRPKFVPKEKKKFCKRCHTDKCHKYERHNDSKKELPYTNAPFLQSVVVFLFQVCTQVQQKILPLEEGTKMINDKIESIEKYRVVETGDMFYFKYNDDGLIDMVFCKRFRLKSSDCIVGFTFQGTENIFTGDESLEKSQIIMKASSVPIDEDMGDALYAPNTGVFVYNSKKN